MKMSNRIKLIIVMMGTVLSACAKTCGPSGPASSGVLEKITAHVEEFRLDNGMLWLLVDHGETPVFTGIVSVKVGGVNETPGVAGLAHMLEHMAFKGSAELGTRDPQAEATLLEKIRTLDAERTAARARGDTAKVDAFDLERKKITQAATTYVDQNEVWRVLHDNGAAEINAHTSKDATTYITRMPSNMLSLWVYVASQMIGAPVMREFYAERDVVAEERRTSVDNNPQGKLYEALAATAFTQSPYRIMAIGPMSEIHELTMSDAEKLHDTWYVPANMVGVIVGHFDHDEAKKILREHFGTIPAREVPPFTVVNDPPQTEERRVNIDFDAGASLLMAYHKPTLPSREDYVFDAIQMLLCDGETSRLRHALEQEQKIARAVSCHNGAPGVRLENLFVIGAQPLQGHTNEDVLIAIEAELAKLRTAPVSAEELEKVRTNLRADFVWGLSESEGLAEQLADFQTMTGDWRYIIRYDDIMRSITPDEVRAIAAKFLLPTQRTIATLTSMKKE